MQLFTVGLRVGELFGEPDQSSSPFGLGDMARADAVTLRPEAANGEGRGGVGLTSCRFGFGGFGGVACISGVRTGTENN